MVRHQHGQYEARAALLTARLSRQVSVPKAVRRMVIDHAYRLHERIANRWTDKFESTPLQVLAERIG